MQALVGQQAPFDHGRQQLEFLADLEVITKAVERMRKPLARIARPGNRAGRTAGCPYPKSEQY
jgi:hypothetical protein